MVVTVHILILAAGSSSRMRGTDKLMQPVDSKPLLRHVVEVALATGSPVAVTLPVNTTTRLVAIEGLPVHIVPVPDASEGMSRSLARGVHAMAAAGAGPADGLMILPADMPGFSTDALESLVAQFRADPTLILRGGTTDGQPGHPSVFPREFWPALIRVTGDEGGRSVIQANRGRVRIMPLPGPMAVLDLDTPEDWAAWRGKA